MNVEAPTTIQREPGEVATSRKALVDNLLGEIRPASRRPDLMPVFSFNSDGVWAAGAQAATPVERLSRWTHLVERMQQEGSE